MMAQLLQSWSDVSFEALNSLWFEVLGVLPLILGALVVFIIGLVVASILENIVDKILKAIKLDSLLNRTGLEGFLRRGGLKIDSGKFFGKIVYWFMVIAATLAASDILRFYAFSDFLKSILDYIPNLIIAVLIMLAAFIVANFFRTLIRTSVSGAQLKGAKFLSSLASWAVIIFGLLAALIQLGVAGETFNIVLSGLVAMLALAGGLAFGLGAKDYAGHLISRIREQFNDQG